MIGGPSGSDYPDGPERMVEDRTKGQARGEGIGPGGGALQQRRPERARPARRARPAGPGRGVDVGRRPRVRRTLGPGLRAVDVQPGRGRAPSRPGPGRRRHRAGHDARGDHRGAAAGAAAPSRPRCHRRRGATGAGHDGVVLRRGRGGPAGGVAHRRDRDGRPVHPDRAGAAGCDRGRGGPGRALRPAASPHRTGVRRRRGVRPALGPRPAAPARDHRGRGSRRGRDRRCRPGPG